MSLFLPEKDRRVVPRWRDFRTTAQTGELEREQFGSPFVIEPGKYFEEKLIAWQQERSVETAAEVVTSALVLGRRTDAVEAARFLARSEEHTSELQSRPHLVCRLLLEKKK